jgi:hypothetical protein
VFNVAIVNAGSPCFLRAGAYDFWRVFPAMDAGESGARKEELLVPQARFLEAELTARVKNLNGLIS